MAVNESRSSEDLTARARIRDAALREFAEHGVSGATIRGIAKAAGVSPGWCSTTSARRRRCAGRATSTSSGSSGRPRRRPSRAASPPRGSCPARSPWRCRCSATWPGPWSTGRRRRRGCSTTRSSSPRTSS
ncbi:TetR/AcrR family transcriptional regulator [Actinomadura keratinilytica]|uniref:TetR/AcrR family transcriptional regulator n=1 Tax=Actinomadura keratinilytica TaxID=547461 RepID=UPI003618A6E3